MIKKQNFYFKSSNKRSRVYGVCWIPGNGKVRAVLQIAHGMVEYIERYDDFARFLCSKGIAVVGNDHLGHGNTAASEKEWGYLGENGFRCIVDDMHKIEVHFKKRFPDVPYFIMGHSMGSFATRYFLTKYGKEVDGAIIMGTGYFSVGLALFGRGLAKSLALVKGWEYRSNFMNKMAFGSYNRGFKPARTEFDWLTRDKAMVDAYIREPRCQFVFTLNGYYELFKGIGVISSMKNIRKMPKDLPVLFVSGDADPVGHNGDGVQKVYDMFVSAGIDDIDMILYEGARHEIINETNRDEVYHDLYDWLNEEISWRS